MLRFIAYLLLCVISYTNLQAQTQKFKVVIDAGHGGRDPGAIGPRKTKEKDVNLAIALELGRLIRANHRDVEVIYTRTTDIFIPLIERTNIANRAHADLFLSLHADAVSSKIATTVHGASTFTLGAATSQESLEVAQRENAVILLEQDHKTSYQGFDPKSPESYIMFETLQGVYQAQSIQAASAIQSQLVSKAKRKNRQVRNAPYLVLRTASMPSVLIETGFLSNPTEEKFLASKNGRNLLANSIYQGFKNYKLTFDRHNNVTVKTDDSQIKHNPTNTQKIEYRLQFLSYHRKLNKGDSQLKGLWPVSYYKEGTTYRYTYGSYSSFSEASRAQQKIKSKFKDAFVIRFYDGKRQK